MYAGTTLYKGSGKAIGVHQRIDRVARRHLNKYISKSSYFPRISGILKFEGRNGPDAIKYINLAKDKPWHFIDPSKINDRDLLVIIENHTMNLARALKDKNEIRSCFEAAWLAHAVVDGLTPAHHYPLAGKVEELWGRPRNEFEKIKDKHVIRGNNKRDTISKNWEYWGAGGVITAHIMFEMGVATSIVPSKFTKSFPSENDIVRLSREGFRILFMESLYRINDLKMYDRFRKRGWNLKLAKETRQVLIPEIIRVVTLAWYQAVIKSEEM